MAERTVNSTAWWHRSATAGHVCTGSAVGACMATSPGRAARGRGYPSNSWSCGRAARPESGSTPNDCLCYSHAQKHSTRPCSRLGSRNRGDPVTARLEMTRASERKCRAPRGDGARDGDSKRSTRRGRRLSSRPGYRALRDALRVRLHVSGVMRGPGQIAVGHAAMMHLKD